MDSDGSKKPHSDLTVRYGCNEEVAVIQGQRPVHAGPEEETEIMPSKHSETRIKPLASIIIIRPLPPVTLPVPLHPNGHSRPLGNAP